MRINSFIDQGLGSLANFALTMIIVRGFSTDEFAGFGIAISVVFVLQGLQRTGFNLPQSLWPHSLFIRRTAGLVGQHLMINFFLAALATGFAFLARSSFPSVMSQSLFIAVPPLLLMYYGIEGERVLLFKLQRSLWALAASIYQCLVVAVLAFMVFFTPFSFMQAMLFLAVTSAARTLVICFLLATPRFGWGLTLLRLQLKKGVGYAFIGSLATTGVSHAPLFVLGGLCAPIHTAAYVAMRTLFQPLQLIIRSTDMVERVLVGRRDHSSIQDVQTHFYKLLIRYFMIGVVIVTPMIVFVTPILSFVYGNKFDSFTHTFYLWGGIMIALNTVLAVETAAFRLNALKPYMGCQLIGGFTAFAASVPLVSWGCDKGAAVAAICGWLLISFTTWFFIIRRAPRSQQP